MFNSHVHTHFSRDCAYSAEEMAEAALKEGLFGICITDHCDMHTFISHNAYQNMLKSNKESKRLAEKYNGRLCVLSGIELGDAYFRHEYSERLLKKLELDTVLLSIHAVMVNGIEKFLSHIDFSSFSENELDLVVKNYFERLFVSVCETDFDICAHLTLPFRYINGVYGRNLPIKNYHEQIKKVLSALIERGKALELNTSELSRQLFDFMPAKDIIIEYAQMGGKFISIGTDAHTPKNIAAGFNEGKKLLYECGFSSYVYYKDRKPIPINLRLYNIYWGNQSIELYKKTINI